MNEKTWNDFEKTGKISDYLSYRMSNPNEIGADINAGEIKPALPVDVGKDEQSDEFPKLHLPIHRDTQNADKNEGNHP